MRKVLVSSGAEQRLQGASSDLAEWAFSLERDVTEGFEEQINWEEERIRLSALKAVVQTHLAAERCNSAETLSKTETRSLGLFHAMSKSPRADIMILTEEEVKNPVAAIPSSYIYVTDLVPLRAGVPKP